ncbi:MAG: hypothetical protein KDJ44_15675 [Rhodoblastus sp.]|nr:hypothetical protein [Rhodoblastus sp.]
MLSAGRAQFQCGTGWRYEDTVSFILIHAISGGISEEAELEITAFEAVLSTAGGVLTWVGSSGIRDRILEWDKSLQQCRAVSSILKNVSRHGLANGRACLFAKLDPTQWASDRSKHLFLKKQFYNIDDLNKCKPLVQSSFSIDINFTFLHFLQVLENINKTIEALIDEPAMIMEDADYSDIFSRHMKCAYMADFISNKLEMMHERRSYRKPLIYGNEEERFVRVVIRAWNIFWVVGVFGRPLYDETIDVSADFNEAESLSDDAIAQLNAKYYPNNKTNQELYSKNAALVQSMLTKRAKPSR